MITGLRTVLIADKIEMDEAGSMNVLGLVGETLRAPSNPGFVHKWLLIAAEVDRRRTTGQVRLEAPEYSLAVPFDVPAGIGLTGFSFPIIVPVLRVGVLHIAAVDDARRAKPFKVEWKIGFDEGAKILDEAEARSIIETARTGGELLTQSLAGRRFN